MPDILKLPVGIESFEEIRKEGFYYIDKTGLIEQLLNQWGKVNLFTRPRRFGKTLNMSMLRYFFEIGTDESLFEGLSISKEKELCKKYMGKFPVIFISLKDVEGLSFEKARYSFIEQIAKEANRFRFLLDSDKLEEDEKDHYRALIAKKNGMFTMNEFLLPSSLQVLSALLRKHYGQKTIILIDEYDVPLDKAFQNKESGDGFADLMIETDDPNAGIVIERKSVEKLAELDKACERAIAQIQDRRYEEYLRNEGRNDIWAYGIAFYKKRCRVVAKKLS